MKQSDLFSNSSCTDQIHLAQRELSAFIAAVAELFGLEQARVSAQDWLDELELMDVSARSTHRDWRTITIAASVQLANRLKVPVAQRVAAHGAKKLFETAGSSLNWRQCRLHRQSHNL
jgi:hypothetical protein